MSALNQQVHIPSEDGKRMGSSEGTSALNRQVHVPSGGEPRRRGHQKLHLRSISEYTYRLEMGRGWDRHTGHLRLINDNLDMGKEETKSSEGKLVLIRR
ncbi:MAG: hypothetical protein ACREHG_07850 [Candidatus Saccharimonadales bacterium]